MSLGILWDGKITTSDLTMRQIGVLWVPGIRPGTEETIRVIPAPMRDDPADGGTSTRASTHTGSRSLRFQQISTDSFQSFRILRFQIVFTCWNTAWIDPATCLTARCLAMGC